MLSRQQKILPAFSGWPFADDSFLPYSSPSGCFSGGNSRGDVVYCSGPSTLSNPAYFQATDKAAETLAYGKEMDSASWIRNHRTDADKDQESDR